MSGRSKKEQKRYKAYLLGKPTDPDYCEFCPGVKKTMPIVAEFTHFRVVKNEFPYSLWDNRRVKEHLMILPNRHVDTIAHFNEDEKVEFLSIVTDFEARGYNVYLRAPGDITKSIDHQHTHLFLPNGASLKTIIYNYKPIIRFLR